jgi:ribosome recycling factor
MSLLHPLVAIRIPTRIYTRLNLPCSPSASAHPQFRSYASKIKAAKSTASLVPGSKQKITDEAAIEDYKKAEKKMQAAIDWYRKEVAGLETRASGRVTPALLSTVRVELPDSKELFRLEDVATVGVRDGSTLLVTLFEERVSTSICLLYTVLMPGLVDHKIRRECAV